MKNKTIAALIAAGLAASIAVPNLAFGAARRTVPTGSLANLRVSQTPYITQLTGANELTATTPTGDPDGFGAASVTLDYISATVAQVCFDLAYSNIAAPASAHLHRGTAGNAGPVVVDFGTPGSTSHSGCVIVDATLADEITASPSGFYVNVHNGDFGTGAMRGQLSAGAPPAGETHLLPEPLRAYDSRDKAGPKIVSGEVRTISLATGTTGSGLTAIAVPPGATGAIITLTITGTTGPGGFLKIYSAALPAQPATSSINWAGTNQNLAVSTQVAIDSTNQVKVAAGDNSTDFVIDVIGFTF